MVPIELFTRPRHAHRPAARSSASTSARRTGWRHGWFAAALVQMLARPDALRGQRTVVRPHRTGVVTGASEGSAWALSAGRPCRFSRAKRPLSGRLIIKSRLDPRPVE